MTSSACVETRVLSNIGVILIAFNRYNEWYNISLVLVKKCWLNHIRILIYASGFLPIISWPHYIAGAFQNGKNTLTLFFLWSTWLRRYGYGLWCRCCSVSQLFPPPPETMGEYRFVVGIRSCWPYFKLESAPMGSFCFLNTDRNGNATLSAANKCDLELGVCKYATVTQNQFHIYLHIQGYSKWLSGYNCPAAIPHQIRETTTIR